MSASGAARGVPGGVPPGELDAFAGVPAVARIGPKNPAPFADSLLTKTPRALPPPQHPQDSPSENRAFQSEPRGDRTHDPRLKRPVPLVGRGGKPSQVVANIGQIATGDSTRHQDLAPFALSFADRLLTAREVAAFLRVSTRTVYALCDEGKLAHVRIANAIRVESAALAALVRSRTE